MFPFEEVGGGGFSFALTLEPRILPPSQNKGFHNQNRTSGISLICPYPLPSLFPLFRLSQPFL